MKSDAPIERKSALDISSFERPLMLCLLCRISSSSTLILVMTSCYLRQDMWSALRIKVLYGLSRCHTKRRTDARGRAHPSFGMTRAPHAVYNPVLLLV